jgi:hypothetical protein
VNLHPAKWIPQMAGKADVRPTHQAPCAGPITHGNPRDPLAGLRQLHARHGPVADLEDEGRRPASVFSPVLVQEVLTDVATDHSHSFALPSSRNSAQRRVSSYSNLRSRNGEEQKRLCRLMLGPFPKKPFDATIAARVEWTLPNPASGMSIPLPPPEAGFTYAPANGSVHDLVELGTGLAASRSRAAEAAGSNGRHACRVGYGAGTEGLRWPSSVRCGLTTPSTC